MTSNLSHLLTPQANPQRQVPPGWNFAGQPVILPPMRFWTLILIVVLGLQQSVLPAAFAETSLSGHCSGSHESKIIKNLKTSFFSEAEAKKSESLSAPSAAQQDLAKTGFSLLHFSEWIEPLISDFSASPQLGYLSQDSFRISSRTRQLDPPPIILFG